MVRALRRLALLAIAASALQIHAQTCATGWAHVTATQIQNIDRSDGATPNLVPYGTFTISAQNGNLQPTSFSIPGGGIATLVPRARAIANGALLQTLCVPRSDLTTPNVGYDITVRDTSPLGGNAVVIHLTSVAINQAEWSFDDYLVTTPQPWHLFAGLAPIPTGTGFAHVTGGTLDGAARPIDLSSADVIGLLPANKISGLSSGGGSGSGGSSWYQFFSSGNVTLPQETTANVDTTSGLYAYDDHANGQTVLGVDAHHFLPRNDETTDCVWAGDGTCTAQVVPSFDSLAGGTSTGKALHVGTGSTLDYTDTGVVNANVLAGVPVTCTASAGFVPVSDGTNLKCRALHPSDLTPDFAISSFTCTGCATYEVGQTAAAPTLHIVYVGGAPTAGTVSDTQAHTAVLATPYTSAVLPAPTALSAAGSICYSVSVTPAATAPSTPCSTYAYRVWAGVGTAGAMTVTASGTTLTLGGGGTGTLASVGLANASSYAFTISSSGGVAYIVMQGGTHTFKDSNNVVFPMTSTAITVVNQYGVSISGVYWLYASASVNSSYTITPTS